MALVKFGCANTLAFLVFCLGVSTVAQGLVRSWPVLAFCRILVGVFEASIFPVVFYILSSWYKRYQVHQKLAMVYAIEIVSSAFAGVLAYALALMRGHGGLNGWRWIFIVSKISF